MGTLHVDGRDLGLVVAVLAPTDGDGDLTGVLTVASDHDDAFPEGLSVPAWLSPVDRGSAVAIRVRRSGSGGLEFDKRPVPIA